MAPGYVFQVSLRVTVQNQVRIAQRIVVDEVVQFRPLRLTALLQWSVVLSYDKVWDAFRWKQGIRSVFQRIQKIRTLLLLEKSSDFVVVVHLQGLEPWAH